MIIVPCMYGGFGNNLHQLGNCFTFFKNNKINLDYLRIIPRYENRYNSILYPKQSKDFIFKELTQFYINDFDFSNIEHINYQKNIKDLNLKLNYIFDVDFLCDHKILYNFLNIKSKIDFCIKQYNFCKNNTICIHIRRCDFNKYLKIDEILNIINYHKNDICWIMTDDIDFCKNNLKIYNNVNYFYDMNLCLDKEFLIACSCNKIYGTPGSTLSYMLKYYNNYYYE